MSDRRCWILVDDHELETTMSKLKRGDAFRLDPNDEWHTAITEPFKDNDNWTVCCEAAQPFTKAGPTEVVMTDGCETPADLLQIKVTRRDGYTQKVSGS